MMRKLYLAAVALALLPPFYCAHAYTGPRDFEPYVNTFLYQAGARGLALNDEALVIVFDELSDWPSNVIGLCDTTVARLQRVFIKGSWWANQTDTQRLTLTHHELGHCLLNRLHFLGRTDEYPISMMYPVVLSEAQFLAREADYLNELFHMEDEIWTRTGREHVCVEDDVQ